MLSSHLIHHIARQSSPCYSCGNIRRVERQKGGCHGSAAGIDSHFGHIPLENSPKKATLARHLQPKPPQVVNRKVSIQACVERRSRNEIVSTSGSSHFMAILEGKSAVNPETTAAEKKSYTPLGVWIQPQARGHP